MFVDLYIYIYIYIYINIHSTHILCKQKLVFWMRLIAINHLTAVIVICLYASQEILIRKLLLKIRTCSYLT